MKKFIFIFLLLIATQIVKPVRLEIRHIWDTIHCGYLCYHVQLRNRTIQELTTKLNETRKKNDIEYFFYCPNNFPKIQTKIITDNELDQFIISGERIIYAVERIDKEDKQLKAEQKAQEADLDAQFAQIEKQIDSNNNSCVIQ